MDSSQCSADLFRILHPLCLCAPSDEKLPRTSPYRSCTGTEIPKANPDSRSCATWASAPEGMALGGPARCRRTRNAPLTRRDTISLFPAADSADEILLARRRKQQTKPLPVRDALEESKCVRVGFHEVFGALCDRLGPSDVFTERQTMSPASVPAGRTATPGGSPKKRALKCR